MNLLFFFFPLARAGIEPRTFSVKGRRSTTELSSHCVNGSHMNDSHKSSFQMRKGCGYVENEPQGFGYKFGRNMDALLLPDLMT